MSTQQWDRRALLAAVAAGAATVCWRRLAWAQDETQAGAAGGGAVAGLAAHPARWWKSAGDLRVQCELCPQKCRVADRERGTCGVRENHGGQYKTLVYGRPAAIHVDPIEKKPFNHVLPGKTALSLGTPGCNMQCKFCQNWEISQARPEQVKTFDKPPDAIVEMAKQANAPAVACTYTEPVVWSEYVYDIAAAAHKAGLRSLMVSNGFIQAQPMTDLAGVLDAVKVDLKAFTETFYHDTCGASLAPVLDTLRLLARRHMWIEIVVLVIPGLNDSVSEAQALARFVHNELGAHVPVHFTRFHPSYRLLNVPSTPVPTLTAFRNAAMAEGLQFVYVGNVLGHPGNNTYCPNCRNVVIRRADSVLLENRLQDGKCPDCGRAIPGIWS